MTRRLLSYYSPKTEVKNSSIHGKGLFAHSKILKEEIVCVKGGYILPQKEWDLLEDRLGSAQIQISENLFIAPVTREERHGAMLYINHSCDPNIGVKGQIIFAAMRDIDPGEELTHDWATTDDLDYNLKCNCGSLNCRKILTGKDWKDPKLQKKYSGWFSWYLQKKIVNR